MSLAKQNAKTAHFYTMDGLRGVAAVMVVIFHRRFWIPGFEHWHGYLAVDFFFILSGFVIGHAYGERLASGRMSMLDFVIARVIRLYPLIFLGAVLGTLGLVIEGIEKSWLGLVVRALVAMPLAILALPQPFLDLPFSTNQPVWSLFFEIIANLAYVALIPRLSTRTIAVATAGLGIALAAMLASSGEMNFGYEWSTMGQGLMRVAFPFTFGVLIQRLFAAGRLYVPGLPAWVLAPLLIGLLSVPVQGTKLYEMLFTILTVFILFPFLVASASNDKPSNFWMNISKISAYISYPIQST